MFYRIIQGMSVSHPKISTDIGRPEKIMRSNDGGEFVAYSIALAITAVATISIATASFLVMSETFESLCEFKCLVPRPMRGCLY